MGDSGAKLILYLFLISFGLGFLVIGGKWIYHKKNDDVAEYSIEENCDSNNDAGFYPYVPGC